MLRSNDDLKKSTRMQEVFPRTAKCLFYKYGMTGSIETDDVFCVLPQNIINEKIYLVMWVWFIILTIIASIQVREERSGKSRVKRGMKARRICCRREEEAL